MTAPLLELRGVRFGYEPTRPVLAGVDLTVSAGERLALVGPNGSGKTTLLHVLVGLVRPQAGSVWAFGRPRRVEQDFWEVRVRAGLLFQDADDQLFSPTVAEDVAFGPLNVGRSRQEALVVVGRTLERLGLAGYEDRVTYELSTGEKRLVALATVLALEPDVLLLDEPTAGLDDATLERLVQVLTDLPLAMVVVAHDRAFLERIATRTARLSDGRLEVR